MSLQKHVYSMSSLGRMVSGTDIATHETRRHLAPTRHRRTNPEAPLKWAGGKRWLVPYLEEYWANHSHRRLVEPFCGGLAVALGLMPESALLNDINPHLINFFRWVSKGLEIEIDMRNDKELYYAHRTRFNQLIEQGLAGTKEAAELFYYLNRTGYNGLCRFNKKAGSMCLSAVTRP